MALLQFDEDALNKLENNMYVKSVMEESRKRARANSEVFTVNETVIEFYGKRRPTDTHGKWFSNCVRSPINIGGVVYNSSEHFYQMYKFVIPHDDPLQIRWCEQNKVSIDDQMAKNNIIRERMAIMGYTEVASFGRNYRDSPVRGDWEKIKKAVMWTGIVHKFEQNLDFSEILLYPLGGTDCTETVLIERAPTDKVWAIDDNGVGTNWLGLQLMMVRKKLFDV